MSQWIMISSQCLGINFYISIAAFVNIRAGGKQAPFAIGHSLGRSRMVERERRHLHISGNRHSERASTNKGSPHIMEGGAKVFKGHLWRRFLCTNGVD